MPGMDYNCQCIIGPPDVTHGKSWLETTGEYTGIAVTSKDNAEQTKPPSLPFRGCYIAQQCCKGMGVSRT